MRVLLVLISFCLLCISCSTSRPATSLQKQVLPVESTPLFAEGVNQSVFRGSIHIYKHYFSGIFALKMEADDKYRMVLMSEVGMTLFDMSFTAEAYHLNYCIEPIKKKSLFKLLHHDFLLLTQAPKQANLQVRSSCCDKEEQTLYKKKNTRDFYTYKEGTMQEIVSKAFLNRTHIQFEELNAGVANFISIQHRPVKLKMNLKRIK
ncbi:hypothetical protein ACXR6G_07815 [Ancylomarina sp. YFZ004]